MPRLHLGLLAKRSGDRAVGAARAQPGPAASAARGRLAAAALRRRLHPRGPDRAVQGRTLGNRRQIMSAARTAHLGTRRGAAAGVRPQLCRSPALRAGRDRGFSVDPRRRRPLCASPDARSPASSSTRRSPPCRAASRSLRGIAGFRGTMVPVYDLAALLGYPPVERAALDGDGGGRAASPSRSTHSTATSGSRASGRIASPSGDQSREHLHQIVRADDFVRRSSTSPRSSPRSGRAPTSGARTGALTMDRHWTFGQKIAPASPWSSPWQSQLASLSTIALQTCRGEQGSRHHGRMRRSSSAPRRCRRCASARA